MRFLPVSPSHSHRRVPEYDVLEEYDKEEQNEDDGTVCTSDNQATMILRLPLFSQKYLIREHA